MKIHIIVSRNLTIEFCGFLQLSNFRVWLCCKVELKIIIIFRKNRKHRINLPTTQVTGIKTAWRGIFQLCCSKYSIYTHFQHRVNCKLCKDVTSCIKNIRRKNLRLQLFWFQMIFGCEPFKSEILASITKSTGNEEKSFYNLIILFFYKNFCDFDICQSFDLIQNQFTHDYFHRIYVLISWFLNCLQAQC